MVVRCMAEVRISCIISFVADVIATSFSCPVVKVVMCSRGGSASEA